MRIVSEKQQKQRQRYLEAQIKNRWAYTACYMFFILESAWQIFNKRLQWPHLFHYPFAFVPFWGSTWVNIFSLVLFPFAIAKLWMQVHNYRRELPLAEQMALQTAAKPPEGVWPPPPEQKRTMP